MFFEICLNYFLLIEIIWFVSIVWFVWSLARSFENFSKNSSCRRDRFGPKIVQFRAILAIFRRFEDFLLFGFVVCKFSTVRYALKVDYPPPRNFVTTPSSTETLPTTTAAATTPPRNFTTPTSFKVIRPNLR